MFLFKTKSRKFHGEIRTTFLFGLIPLYQTIVTRSSKKYYVLGIRVKTVQSIEMKQIFHYGNDSWYSILRDGKNVSISAPVANAVPSLSHGERIQMDVDRALEILPHIDKIALVFFMGIGDYFYSTRFIEKLKLKYPHIPFTAWVSKNSDSNNSPLVAECCRVNPCFDKIRLYDGHANRNHWKNYDYSDVLRQEPATTLILPMLYEHDETVLSRDDTLCETFHLPQEKLAISPLLHDWPINEMVEQTSDKIREIVRKKNLAGVVWLQLNTRSTSFVYEYAKELAQKLLDAGYYVLCVDPIDINDPCCMVLDYSKFSITDSIALLRLLNQKGTVYCLTMVSCFWSISSALNIPNLGVQFYYDEKLASVYFPNIYLVTHRGYSCVSRTKQFVATEADGNMQRDKMQYYPDYLFDCFTTMIEKERSSDLDPHR